jgi:hypothetical protein
VTSGLATKPKHQERKNRMILTGNNQPIGYAGRGQNRNIFGIPFYKQPNWWGYED